MENNNAEQVELTEEELLAQLDEQHRIRIEKLNDLKANGKNPYEITKFDFTHKAQQIRDNFEELEEKDVMIPAVSQAGVIWARPTLLIFVTTAEECRFMSALTI